MRNEKGYPLMKTSGEIGKGNGYLKIGEIDILYKKGKGFGKIRLAGTLNGDTYYIEVPYADIRKLVKIANKEEENEVQSK